MISTEDRLRAAARAAADTVTPGSAPPLRLPAEPGRLGGDRRRWLRAMTPLAAAAAVAAGVVISLTLTLTLTLTSGQRTPARGGAGPAAGSSAPGRVPPYYVELDNSAPPVRHAVVRATATGAALATLTPPRPYRTFSFVSAAADDRTFVLAAQRWWNITGGTRGLPAEHRDNVTPVVFFLLRFDPATGTARLTPLSGLAGPPSAELAGIGLSPDGTRLALALHTVTASGGSGQPALRGPGIRVMTLATGALRQWAWPGASWIGNFKPFGEPLSWTADGRLLAFQEWHGNDTQIRLLDTAAPGSDLRSSRLVATFTDGYRITVLNGGNSLVTPDGSAVVVATVRYEQHPVRTKLQISEFSTRTGTVTHALARWILGRRGATWQDVLWASPSGRTLIVVTPPGKGPAEHRLNRMAGPVAGIVTTGGQFIPLPGLRNIGNVAW
jgi:hypothetical protein